MLAPKKEKIKKARIAKIIDLPTGMIAEADLEDFEIGEIEKSVTAIVWSTGCPVYDRVPWLLNGNSSKRMGWQDLVEPGSLIVLVESAQKEDYFI